MFYIDNYGNSIKTIVLPIDLIECNLILLIKDYRHMIFTYNFTYTLIQSHLSNEYLKYPHFRTELSYALAVLPRNLQHFYQTNPNDCAVYTYLKDNYYLTDYEIMTKLKPTTRYLLSKKLADKSI